MTASRTSIPQVVVLTPLTLKGHRDFFEGIMRYARVNGPWRLYRMEGRAGEQRLRDMKRWGCSGIIAGACSLNAARAVAETNVPTVVFEPDPEMRTREHPLSRFSCLRIDSKATGEKAALFFMERGYKNYAFVGEIHDLYWSLERRDGFREKVESAGWKYFEYTTATAETRKDWAIEQPHMATWLKSLPKPVAVFAAMDGRAHHVLDACMDAGITVPEEIAVLGVDDDPFICNATFPTLSSIQLNSEHAGYLLAKHLDDLMRGRSLRKRIYWIKPTRMAQRRSTEATAIADKHVSRAIEFIWREAGHRSIHVPDVVKVFGASRRYAETRFKTAVGRTIMEEIRRVKLQRVCALLSETSLSIGEITRQCDFARESHLAYIFRKHYGMTMREYRVSTCS